MKFLKQYFNTFLALLPIVAIVLFVHFFIYSFDPLVLIGFLASVAIISLGETFLLMGIDSTIMPMGEYMVSSVSNALKMLVFIVFAVIFGMFATIAEPDVAIFSNQVIASGVGINKDLLQFCIGGGVGLFIAFAIIKIIKKFDVRFVYISMFALIFALAAFVDKDLVALAFDAGGATTGIITAPFLMAIASGVSSKFSKSNEQKEVFGMVGIASLGPIIITLIIFLILGDGADSILSSSENVNIFLSVLRQSYMSILPIIIVFSIYDLLLVRLPLKRKGQLLLGLFVTFAGMYLFLFGIDFGISQMATKFGEFLASQNELSIILISVLIGFVLTFTEPAVVVLAKRVEEETQGNISYILVLLSIAASMALAIALSVLKILFGLNFFIIVLVGYLIALSLMFFVPSIFTNLSFDSGGVASGPMTAAFLLPMMLAIASTSSSAIAGFGIVGIVSMTPIIVVQFMGLFYNVGLKKKRLFDRRRAISLSYSKDVYSNLEPLEKLLAKKQKTRRKTYAKKR